MNHLDALADELLGCACWWITQMHLLMNHWDALANESLGRTCWWITRTHLLMNHSYALAGGTLGCTCWWITRRRLLMNHSDALADEPPGRTCWWITWTHLLMNHLDALATDLVRFSRISFFWEKTLKKRWSSSWSCWFSMLFSDRDGETGSTGSKPDHLYLNGHFIWSHDFNWC